tara:strand:+ start:309 stop:653 length:345 start_codon:yes stop_codon:yes gene_type:complete
MTTFTWAVTALYTETIAGEQDYVVIANYEVVGVDATYSASLSNIARFSTETVSTFIPYDNLTNDIVIGWIQEGLGVDGVNNLEACIQGQIDSQANPPVSPVSAPLPWAPAPVEA